MPVHEDNNIEQQSDCEDPHKPAKWNKYSLDSIQFNPTMCRSISIINEPPLIHFPLKKPDIKIKQK